MHVSEQQAIRDKTAAIIIDWANQRQPAFTGESAEGFVEAITVAHLVADEARLGVHRWVDAARRTGVSWTDIGDALGISKQAAQQRFRLAETFDESSETQGELIVRRGANAFNEMTILRDEGCKGNELVDFGGLWLGFRATRQIWAYKRRIGLKPSLTDMQAAGWTYVASWLPFHYFKRPIGCA